MRVLGIDPGTASLGYGLVSDDDDLTLLAGGVLRTEPTVPMPQRLLHLYEGVRALTREHRPEVMAVEQLFHARNATTSISVGQARGVVLLAAAQGGIPVVEYSPMEVKQAVVGYGGATKHQIQEMVRLLLRLDAPPRPDDAADALAVAICHLHSARFTRRLETSRSSR